MGNGRCGHLWRRLVGEFTGTPKTCNYHSKHAPCIYCGELCGSQLEDFYNDTPWDSCGGCFAKFEENELVAKTPGTGQERYTG